MDMGNSLISLTALIAAEWDACSIGLPHDDAKSPHMDFAHGRSR
jgi:hypothetical protein